MGTAVPNFSCFYVDLGGTAETRPSVHLGWQGADPVAQLQYRALSAALRGIAGQARWATHRGL